MIEYREADLFDVIPEFARGVVVAHVCNNIGAWGAGFTRGLSQRFPETERAFRVWSDPRRLGQGPVRVHTTSGRYALGAVQLVRLSDAVSVVNMVAQVGIGVGPRLDYAALGTCLSYLAVAGPVQDAGVVLLPHEDTREALLTPHVPACQRGEHLYWGTITGSGERYRAVMGFADVRFSRPSRPHAVQPPKTFDYPIDSSVHLPLVHADKLIPEGIARVGVALCPGDMASGLMRAAFLVGLLEQAVNVPPELTFAECWAEVAKDLTSLGTLVLLQVDAHDRILTDATP